MRKSDFIAEFKDSLLALGVRQGGVLMVHPALRPFGYVPDGPETIIQGLLETVGRQGTLLMPALSYETVTRQNPVFNSNATPSCVGAIAESFRKRPGTRRSIHPTHSVCGVGPCVDELFINHTMDSTPCGSNSPFHRLPAHQGQILFLACGLMYNTSMHAIEEMVEPPYLYEPPIRYKLTDEQGNSWEKEYIPHNFIGWRQRYDKVETILDFPALRTGLVVKTTCHLVEAKELWPAALAALQNNPLYFVEHE